MDGVILSFKETEICRRDFGREGWVCMRKRKTHTRMESVVLWPHSGFGDDISITGKGGGLYMGRADVALAAALDVKGKLDWQKLISRGCRIEG